MIKYLLNKYKELKEDYLARSPKGKWLFVRNFGIFLLKSVGLEILDPNFKVWWYSYVSNLLVFNFFTSFTYTIWFYWDNQTRAFMVTPYFGILIPSILMFILVIRSKSRKKIQKLILFAGDNIYTEVTENSDPKYIHISNQSAVELLKDTLITLGLLFGTCSVFGIYPMYMFIYKREIELPIPILFPFTDLETSVGIVLNLLNQLTICGLGSLGNFGIELCTSMVKKTSSAFTAAIGYSIDQLSDSIENCKPTIDYEFRNLLIQVQDFDRYILILSKVFYWKFFIQPYLLTFSISLALYFFIYENWVPGISVAIFTYTQLYVLCDIGQEVTTANKNLLLKLHTLPWYGMSRKNQLDYAHALHRLQNGAVIQMGPFAELNFETFSDMTKRIYTLIMTLIRILK